MTLQVVAVIGAVLRLATLLTARRASGPAGPGLPSRPTRAFSAPPEEALTEQLRLTPPEEALAPPEEALTEQLRLTPPEEALAPPEEALTEQLRLTPPEEALAPPEEALTEQLRLTPPEEALAPPEEAPIPVEEAPIPVEMALAPPERVVVAPVGPPTLARHRVLRLAWCWSVWVGRLVLAVAAAVVLGTLQAGGAGASSLGRGLRALDRGLEITLRVMAVGARRFGRFLAVACRPFGTLVRPLAPALAPLTSPARRTLDRAGQRVGRVRRTWGASAPAPLRCAWRERRLLGAFAVVVVLGALAAAEAAPPGPPTQATAALPGARAQGVTGTSSLVGLLGPRHFHHLKPAVSAPHPAPPSVADAPPLRRHEVFGFAPYWSMGDVGALHLPDLTTVAYFDVNLNPNGSLVTNDAGWNGFESQDFTNLVDAAHQAGDRVVLTVGDFDQSSLDHLTSDPSAPGRLAQAVLSAVESKNLDGVNLDLEGEGSADQAGLTNLVQTVATTLHSANPHYQVTMDTYATSAGDPTGFFNIKALAPSVDGFFVMEYEYNLQSGTSRQSPITSQEFSDLQTLEQYVSTVTPSKVIMGVPFYGEDWTTTNGTQSASATGLPNALTYASIKAAGHPVYWDSVTDTPWTSYQSGGSWHETYFEDPTSLAMETELAERYGVGGMGVWALGMDGNDPSLMAALLGNAPAKKDTLAGPLGNPSAGHQKGTPEGSTLPVPRTYPGGAVVPTLPPAATTLPNLPPTTTPTTAPTTTTPPSTTTSSTAPPSPCQPVDVPTPNAFGVAWKSASGQELSRRSELTHLDCTQPTGTQGSVTVTVKAPPTITSTTPSASVLSCLVGDLEKVASKHLALPAVKRGKTLYVSAATLEWDASTSCTSGSGAYLELVPPLASVSSASSTTSTVAGP